MLARVPAVNRGPLRWIEPSAGALRESELAWAQTDPPDDLPDPELTENARTVLARRYLLRDEQGQVVETPRKMYWRVAQHVAGAELEYPGGTEQIAYDWARRFYRAMAARQFLPNSPTLHNSGTAHPMCSACFVIPIQDSIESIYSGLRAAALVHKAGGGTGFDFSRLRPHGDRVGPTGGTTDGPVSFLRAYSQATAAIRQGSFRQGANMGILRCDHPDILEFIAAKHDMAELTNFNISVAITDEFLDRLSSNPNLPHEVVHPRSGARTVLRRSDESHWTVGELWRELAEHAHKSGEPGLFFVDRANADDPVPSLGPIRATNPCGEQPLHDWDSCNLGSLNIAAFVRESDGEVDFDWDSFANVARLATRFLDDVIEAGELPLPELTEASRKTRRIGLGVMGFADALFRLALPYDTEEACAFGEQVMRVLSREAFETSRQLASERGCFEAWSESRYARENLPMRNAFRTTVAPTGTISILAGCSGGIEPVFSLVYLRQVMADEFGEPTILREVDATFERTARRQGFWSDDLVARILERGSLREIEQVPELLREVFVTARDIAPRWHLAMQAAFQTHCDSSISKTINFPADATVEQVAELFDLAIEHDVRGLTCYRDGSRDRQPMALSGSMRSSASQAPLDLPAARIPTPIDLPEVLPSLSLRQTTSLGPLAVRISIDPASGAELEVSAHLDAPGDHPDADLTATCRMLSLWLRASGKLEVALDEIRGRVGDGGVRAAAPQVEGLVAALRRYLVAKQAHGTEALLLGKVPPNAWRETPRSAPIARRSFAPRVTCPQCGGELAFQEGCAKCQACGFGQC